MISANRFSALLICVALALSGDRDTLAASSADPTPFYLETPISVIESEAENALETSFRVPLENEKITRASPIREDRVLLTLDGSGLSTYAIYDVASGEEVWTSPFYYRLGTVLPGMVIFQFSEVGSNETELIAIDENGKQIWDCQLNHSASQLIPIAGGVLIAKGYAPSSEFTAVSAQHGSVLWSGKELSPDVSEYDTIHALGDAAYLADEGFLAKISPVNGDTLWINDEIHISKQRPIPRWEDGILFFVAAGNAIVAVGAEDGEIQWNLQLTPGESVNNLFPKDGDLYVRSTVTGEDGASNSYTLRRVSADGKLLWHFADKTPIVSNLVDAQGNLFGATSQELLALDLDSGRNVYRKQFSSLPSSYPIAVYAFEDHVVVLGELSITSYEAARGIERYRHRFGPVLPNVSVTLMDRSIAKLRASKVSGGYDHSMLDASAYFSQQAAISQERSNSLYNSYLRKRAFGDGIGAQKDWTSSQLESSWAKTNAIVSVQFMGLDGILAYEASELAKAAQKTNKLLGKRIALRNTIVNQFPEMTQGDYAYRPVGISADNGAFMGVAIVHMPTGEKTVTTLSPVYRDYGLWLMLDLQKQEVVYQGLGLDTSEYHWKTFGPEEAYESYLIRQSVPIQ
jgi:outer membrane protein assembly factor BamB